MKIIKHIYLSIDYRIGKLKYIVVSLYNNIIKKVVKGPEVINTNDTIDKIIKDKCSVSRFGEGEFKLMKGQNLLFQNSSEELRLKMKDVLFSQNENHIVCIPDVFKNLDRFTNKAYTFWNTYLNTDRNYIYSILDMNKKYYDALMTRVYIDYKDKSSSQYLFDKIKKIWDGRDITIVEGDKSRLGIGNDLFNNVNSINRILCPSENAFFKYNEILKEIKKIDEDRLILIALGPTATVLAYDLSKLGYQAIDIGHIDIEYEWFLKRVNEKCRIEKKYVGEVINGNEVEGIDDNTYANQIICKID